VCGLLLTACGSTVQVRGSASTGMTGLEPGTVGAGTALGGPVTQAGGSVPGAAAGSTTTGATTPGSVITPGASGGSAAPRTGGSVAIPARGPGWDEKFVYVGVVTQKDTQRVFASFGADNVNPGDTEQQAQAAVDAVNAQGGILGRQLKIRFKDIGILQTAQDPSGVGQQVCTYYTQDQKVVAVWNVSTQLDQAPTFRGCLAKARIPLFSTAARAVDDKLFNDLSPYYYHSMMVSWTRLAPVFVSRLRAQGYFGGWNTTLGRAGTAPVSIGILVQDEPQGHRTATVLTNALHSAGYRSVLTYAYSDPSQGQSSSVQKFKGSNVTHVIVTDVELTAFQQAASTQAYKPRYGITTYNDPYSNLEASGLTPSGANNGAVGVGWAPGLDVSDGNDPGPTPGWSRCAAAMKKRGQTFSGLRLARAYASTLCDTMLLLRGGAAAGRGFSGAAVRAGIQSIAGSFAPAIGFAPALGASTPFVPGMVRDIAWDTGCSCVKYGSGRARL
jgi:ABC-type branched-subunit amino acid transport system substrate-binding protein